jgi:hypothetical protein
MAGDVVGRALSYASTVRDLFESVPPSVIGLDMLVVNSHRTDPICEPLAHLCIGRLLLFPVVFAFPPSSHAVEQRAFRMIRYELEETLCDQMLV